MHLNGKAKVRCKTLLANMSVLQLGRQWCITQNISQTVLYLQKQEGKQLKTVQNKLRTSSSLTAGATTSDHLLKVNCLVNLLMTLESTPSKFILYI